MNTLVAETAEREVLKLLVYGYSNGEFAANNSISTKTIDTYKTRVMEKLNFTQKREMVSYALKYNLLTKSFYKSRDVLDGGDLAKTLLKKVTSRRNNDEKTYI